MAIWDIYSKRVQRALAPESDVYTYDSMPQRLRVQTVHILEDMIGPWAYGAEGNRVYEIVNKTLCKEYGVFTLTEERDRCDESIFNFVLHADEADKALDVVELTFTICSYVWEESTSYSKPITGNPSDAIDEFNARCKEHAFGYQFESGKIIRIDSTFIHKEAVKPVLSLLSAKAFNGANQEFLLAHEHYRHKRYKECIVESLKALESTIKTIANARGWSLQKTPNAKALIDACFSNGLLDPMLTSYVTGIRTTLESGLPTVRNQTSGHGQGDSPIAVPDYFARFALNQAATCILMLVEAHNHKS